MLGRDCEYASVASSPKTGSEVLAVVGSNVTLLREAYISEEHTASIFRFAMNQARSKQQGVLLTMIT
jgi:hypothetical protein